ncbi:hypothetical protein CRM22_011085 [Opisthorchis felineus]|uniref:Ion transport domain-containing protein n=1 Tax=Opisthorchis felineus TaxID=147828 RepID=A0A4S2KFN2_OPIFE|nr:hypothetical protein CRM22_011085 [Opisthorchis felineus]
MRLKKHQNACPKRSGPEENNREETDSNYLLAARLSIPERPRISVKSSSDVDLSITDSGLGTIVNSYMKTAGAQEQKTSSCFQRPRGWIRNRVVPLENIIVLPTNKQQECSDPKAAFSYVKYDEFECLVDLVAQNPSVIHQVDQNKQTLLHHAASTGNLKMMKFLVANNAQYNEVDHCGNLPLHLAIMGENKSAAKFLLSIGSEAGLPNKDGLQPIHLAAERNDKDTLKILLKTNEIDVNAEGERGASPLHYCCQRDSVDCLLLLLENGADIYSRDLEYTYPIHVAIANISPNCVRALFAHEESFHAARLEQRETRTPVTAPTSTASRISLEAEKFRGSAGAVSIGKGASSFDRKRRKSTTEKKLLHLAQTLRRYSRQQLETEQCLIDLVDCEGETPLHTAVTSGDAEMVKICLKKQAWILATQNDESTPVHYACIKDDLECVDLMLNARPEEKETVLRMPNKNGYTPLHLAAVYNHEQLVQYLVEKGSPLELTDGNGWTPLLLAAMKGSFRACIQLLRLGANPNAHDVSNRNLVHLLMLFRGPGVRTVLPEVNDEALFKQLVNEKDVFGCTPLHYSTKMGNLGATSAFVLRGASALERDNDRDTPLHTAAHFGRLHTCERLLDTSHGMRAMNSPDALGRLPLHVAVEQGHVEVVKLFLEKGCVFRKCHLGNTPLHYAAIGGCIKTCRILLQTNPSLLDQTNFHGLTALHYAARANNTQVLECLLTANAAFVPDNDGLYFVTYALQQQNYEAMKVIVTHSRWPEIHGFLDNTIQCPVDGFIRDMPNMCALVLDQSIKEVGSRNLLECEVFYDFTVLQRSLSPNEPIPKDPMKRMKLMVELQRKELLIHPLCTAYLQRKWQTYGQWIQLSATAYYAILLVAITSLVLGHSPIRHVESWDRLKPCFDLFYQTQTRRYIFSAIALLILVLTVFDLFVKIWQLITQRLEYFKDWNNYLEFLLNALAMTYSALTLVQHVDHHYVGLGVIVMFLAWFNFLLQMMRFNHVGIYVVMFLHVLATVGKCLVVFSVVFVAFALSFHVLFRVPQYKIGLAVGDIEHVRQSSVLRLISQQVYWLADWEPKLMSIFRSKIYSPHWKRKGKRDTNVTNRSEEAREEQPVDAFALHNQIKEILTHILVMDQQLRIQGTRTQAIVEKLGVKTREYTMDEGIYPGF